MLGDNYNFIINIISYAFSNKTVNNSQTEKQLKRNRYISTNFPKGINKLSPNIKDICRGNVKESSLWPAPIHVTIKTKPSYFLRQNLLQTEIKVETSNHWIQGLFRKAEYKLADFESVYVWSITVAILRRAVSNYPLRDRFEAANNSE